MEDSRVGHSSHPYLLTPGDADRHLDVVARFVSEAFAGGEHVEEIGQKYLRNGHYDWDTTQLIWDADELVHHWGVWGYGMRVDDVSLRTAGVGAVVTRESHRQRGLMHRAALASFDAMRANGYHLSVLRGRHYARYDYVRAWNYVTYRIERAAISARATAPAFQLLTPGMLDAVNHLYNTAHTRLSGTAVRPTYPILDKEDMQVYGWFDDQGLLCGYVRAPVEEGNTLRCLEGAGDAEECLAVLGALMDERKQDSLELFSVHHQHPLSQALRTRACVIEERFFKQSGWQVRMVNLRACLQKLCPCFERRLQHSRMAGWEGILTLEGSRETADLSVSSGRVVVLDGSASAHFLRAGAALARFIIGSDQAEEIIRQEEVECGGDGAGLASILFPNLQPLLSHWDGF